MTSILLLRHGESEWNAQGRWQGWADIPLSATGRRQALEAGERLHDCGITTVVASDLGRTTETASIIAGILGLAPVHAEPDLREFNVGEWSGMTRPEIEVRWPGQLRAWDEGGLVRTPGGESRAGFVDRIRGALLRTAAHHRDEVVLAVTHGGVVGALQRALTAADAIRIGNLMGRWVDVVGKQLELGPVVRLLDAGETTLSPSP